MRSASPKRSERRTIASVFSDLGGVDCQGGPADDRMGDQAIDRPFEVAAPTFTIATPPMSLASRSENFSLSYSLSVWFIWVRIVCTRSLSAAFRFGSLWASQMSVVLSLSIET